MPKFHMDRRLKFWVMAQVNVALATSDDLKRSDLIFEVLSEFYRCGDAERYVRPNGKIGWRATALLIERLEDAEDDHYAEADV